MKYPALIKKEKDGKYSVSLPDFKGGKFGVCVSCGDTLEEAKKNAEEALRLHVEGLLEDSKEFGSHLDWFVKFGKLPTPSIAIAINIKV